MIYNFGSIAAKSIFSLYIYVSNSSRMSTGIENKDGRILAGIALILMVLTLSVTQVQAETEGTYKGKFSLPPGAPQGVAYYKNTLVITIKLGAVSGNLDFIGGSSEKNEEYVHFTGAFKGELQEDSFDANGTPTLLLLDGKKDGTGQVGFRLTGVIAKSGTISQITGKLIITNTDEGDIEFLSYTALLSDGEGLQLTFPLGKSPKVFDKGWKFGASCIINQGTSNEVDLSDNIKWSGTATFKPDKGPLSRPVFEKEGSNSIILTAQDAQGNIYEQEYKVDVVLASKYAHTGCIVICPSDAHGCPSCPHKTVGYIIGSANDATVNGFSAAVVGDNGLHSACCGPNHFILNEGDPNVLIQGKQAVLLGAKTEHCGGTGNVRKSIPKLGQVLTANDSAYYIDPFGKLDKVNGDRYNRLETKYIGTTYVTREKGILTLSLLPNGLLSVGPNSQIVILSDAAGVMKIRVDRGNIYFNGQSASSGEVVIELKDCDLVLKGTRFSLAVNDQLMKLDLLEGNIDLKFNKSGEIVPISEGESITSDFISVTDRKTLDTLAVTQQWQQVAQNTPGTKLLEFPDESTSENLDWKKYLTSQNMLIAGSIVFVLSILAGFSYRRKRKFIIKKKFQVQPLPADCHTPQPVQPAQTHLPQPASKFCQSCGNPLKTGSKFCSKCGHVIP